MSVHGDDRRNLRYSNLIVPHRIMVDPLVLAWHNEMVQQENFDEEFESQDAVDRFTSTMERTS